MLNKPCFHWEKNSEVLKISSLVKPGKRKITVSKPMWNES